MERLASVIWKELIHDMKAVSGSVSPEDSTESFNRLGTLSIVSAVGNIGYVRAQLINNLVGILKLLWRKIGVIAVSYTHLDVYKRQRLPERSGWPFSFLFAALRSL